MVNKCTGQEENKNRQDLSMLYAALEKQYIAVTPKRQEVIQFIYESKELEDIETAWVTLRQSSKVSWATMYCTVRLLVRAGWLQVDATGKRRKYIIKQEN